MTVIHVDQPAISATACRDCARAAMIASGQV
jgi:hypothetical protein